MKKIINGRMYDTETAKKIGVEDAGDPFDYGWTSKTLYQKRNGEFFIYGWGNGFYGGEVFIPLQEDEAKEFVEDYLDADVYISIWGVPEE